MKALTPIILLIIAVVVFFYFTDPVLSQIGELQGRKQELERGLKNADLLAKRQDELIRERNDITEEQLSRLDKLIPGKVDNVRLIIEMGRIGSRNGMPLRNVVVTAGTTAEDGTTSLPSSEIENQLNEVGISFSVSGPYNLFKSFMANLADNLRILDVKSFTVSAKESGLYDYNVNLTTYWLKK